MRMIAGAVLILAASVCAAGYQVARAFNAFSGGPLPFLSWALGIVGLATLVGAWMEELKSRAENSPADGEKPPAERSRK
jgi:hypothetical protein